MTTVHDRLHDVLSLGRGTGGRRAAPGTKDALLDNLVDLVVDGSYDAALSVGEALLNVEDLSDEDLRWVQRAMGFALLCKSEVALAWVAYDVAGAQEYFWEHYGAACEHAGIGWALARAYYDEALRCYEGRDFQGGVAAATMAMRVAELPEPYLQPVQFLRARCLVGWGDLEEARRQWTEAGGDDASFEHEVDVIRQRPRSPAEGDAGTGVLA